MVGPADLAAHPVLTIRRLPQATARVHEAMAAGGKLADGHRRDRACRDGGLRRRSSARRLQPGVSPDGAPGGAAGSARLTHTRGEDHRGAVLASTSPVAGVCATPERSAPEGSGRSSGSRCPPSIVTTRLGSVARRSRVELQAGRSRPARPTTRTSGQSRRAGAGRRSTRVDCRSKLRAQPGGLRSRPPSPAFAPRGRGGPSLRQASSSAAGCRSADSARSRPASSRCDPRPPGCLLLRRRRLRVRRDQAQPARPAPERRATSAIATMAPSDSPPRTKRGGSSSSSRSTWVSTDWLGQLGCERRHPTRSLVHRSAVQFIPGSRTSGSTSALDGARRSARPPGTSGR